MKLLPLLLILSVGVKGQSVDTIATYKNVNGSYRYANGQIDTLDFSNIIPLQIEDKVTYDTIPVIMLCTDTLAIRHVSYNDTLYSYTTYYQEAYWRFGYQVIKTGNWSFYYPEHYLTERKEPLPETIMVWASTRRKPK